MNDPLQYKGIWFYQSSYGDSWDRIQVARLNIKDKETDKVLSTVDLPAPDRPVNHSVKPSRSSHMFAVSFLFFRAGGPVGQSLNGSLKRASSLYSSDSRARSAVVSAS